MNKGVFLAIEGLDGSGKTTQVELLAATIALRGTAHTKTKEPTLNSETGVRIRSALRGEVAVPANTLQEWFAQDRAWHLQQEVLGELEGGTWVVSDRCYISSVAYGAADGLDKEWLLDLNAGFFAPDAVIFLDTSPETCMERIASRGSKLERFETLERLAAVREQYLALASHMVVVDGERSPEEIHEEIARLVL